MRIETERADGSRAVFTGARAALGVKHLALRVSGFTTLTRRAPYFSRAVILRIGV